MKILGGGGRKNIWGCGGEGGGGVGVSEVDGHVELQGYFR